MSVLEWRGGFPAVFRGTVATTGIISGDDGETIPSGEPLIPGNNLRVNEDEGRRGPVHTKWIEIRNLDTTATNMVQVYFTQRHFDDDVHALVIPGGPSALSVWSVPAEAAPPRGSVMEGIWLRASAGTPEFCVTAIARRG